MNVFVRLFFAIGLLLYVHAGIYVYASAALVAATFVPIGVLHAVGMRYGIMSLKNYIIPLMLIIFTCISLIVCWMENMAPGIAHIYNLVVSVMFIILVSKIQGL